MTHFKTKSPLSFHHESAKYTRNGKYQLEKFTKDHKQQPENNQFSNEHGTDVVNGGYGHVTLRRGEWIGRDIALDFHVNPDYSHVRYGNVFHNVVTPTDPLFNEPYPWYIKREQLSTPPESAYFLLRYENVYHNVVAPTDPLHSDPYRWYVKRESHPPKPKPKPPPAQPLPPPAPPLPPRKKTPQPPVIDKQPQVVVVQTDAPRSCCYPCRKKPCCAICSCCDDCCCACCPVCCCPGCYTCWRLIFCCGRCCCCCCDE